MDDAKLKRLEELRANATAGRWEVSAGMLLGDRMQPVAVAVRGVTESGLPNDDARGDRVSFIRGDDDELYLAELTEAAPALLRLARQALGRPVAGRTKDDVRVRMGDRVWWPGDLSAKLYADDDGWTGGELSVPVEVPDCYSTEAAAIAAKDSPNA